MDFEETRIQKHLVRPCGGTTRMSIIFFCLDCVLGFLKNQIKHVSMKAFRDIYPRDFKLERFPGFYPGVSNWKCFRDIYPGILNSYLGISNWKGLGGAGRPKKTCLISLI